MDKLFDLTPIAPEGALSEITNALGRLLQELDTDARERFLMNLIEPSEGDKVSGNEEI